jgi:hypothetical protein
LGPVVSARNGRLDFQDFTEEAFKHIHQVLHSSGGDPCTALDEVENELLFESSSDSDNEDLDANDPFSISGPKVTTHPLTEAIAQSHINTVRECAQCIRRILSFQGVSSYRFLSVPFFLAVNHMRSDGLMIPLTEIGIILTCQRYEYQTLPTGANRKQKVGRLLCVNETNWQHLREFALQRFQEHCRLTTEDALAFLAEHLNVHLLPNLLRTKVRKDCELWVIRDIPMEKERLALISLRSNCTLKYCLKT